MHQTKNTKVSSRIFGGLGMAIGGETQTTAKHKNGYKFFHNQKNTPTVL
jgi:hypothetical protein